MSANKQPAPWLRVRSSDVPAVIRAVLDALELAREDLSTWCGGLSDVELNARPAGIAPVAFHLRHISRSIDRLLTYAEGQSLDERQTAALQSELSRSATKEEVFAELNSALDKGAYRIERLSWTDLEGKRTVGRKQLPTSVAGLLVHIAEHTQRHVGQAITTSKVVVDQRRS